MNRLLTIAQVVWLEMLRRKDVYVLFILLGATLALLVSLNVFGLGAVTGYVKDVGLLMVWVLGWVLAATVSSRELPQEETRRTIFPLLAKPVTRFDLVAGKWLGSWTVVCAAVLCFYVLIQVLVTAMGGRLSPAAMLQGYILHALALGLVCGIGLLFSTRMNHDAAATLTFVLTGASFLVAPRVPELLTKQQGIAGDALLVLYHALPHFELFDIRQRIVHDYGPVSAGTFVQIALYGLAVTSCLLLLSWMAYRRKHFSRGSMQP